MANSFSILKLLGLSVAIAICAPSFLKPISQMLNVQRFSFTEEFDTLSRSHPKMAIAFSIF
ncbi:MAG: hypothetical protein KME17_01695 [Cyanosarcina radialis HA8281-LM2]|nr:hypothetical protein [Cyanosarcina radialis HA8281-LM2]